MRLEPHAILRSRALNGWALFWLISIPMSVAMLIAMLRTDISAPPGVLEMIAFSVRWAVPLIYVVVAASALQVLFPGPYSNWLLRNRRYIGLGFAVAMAWQGLFIFLISSMYRDYYYEEIYYFRDELEGSTGYIFLAAMVVTSFRFGRKYLTPTQWKLLHRSGTYFLWAYPFSVYWWNLFYYDDPVPLDYVYYWSGFLAVALRIAAWGKKRQLAATRQVSSEGTRPVFRGLGAGTMVFGLLVAATGGLWQEPVTAILTGAHWSANLQLWLPFWPFEPFLSLFIVGLGVGLATRAEAKALGNENVVRPAD